MILPENGRVLLFDCETNGLLDTISVIHSLVLKDADTGEVFSFKPGEIQTGVRMLAAAQLIVGHNVIKFDIPALQKIYPWFTIPEDRVLDTIVLSRLIWSDLKDRDYNLTKKGKFPGGRLTGSHSLEAWGHRLGLHKGDYSKDCKAAGIDPWAAWSPEMQRYCELDVEVTAALWGLIQSKSYSAQAIELEHSVAFLCAQMERNGFRFDLGKATALYALLAGKRAELEARLKEVFRPWWVATEDVTPTRTINRKRPDLGEIRVTKTKGKKNPVSWDVWEPVVETVTAGAPYTKVKLTEFNPASRFHIADRLKVLYGWTPTEFTDNGEPKLDDEVLGTLDYPEAALLAEYFLIQKRIGMLAEGKQAWLRLEVGGFIHGSYTTNGAVSGRATHQWPNMGQVPACGTPYGAECRELFTVPPGWLLVGADMSGLELRCLGHFVARFDAGAYIEAVINGDIHWTNAQALGLVPMGEARDDHNETHQWARNKVAKRFIYAFLYGGGDEKIGEIVLPKAVVEAKKREGRKLKRSFLTKTPAIRKLREAVAEACKKGFLVGLDKRKLHVRSEHAAVNLLLQSSGALLCKKWLVIIDRKLRALGLKHGWKGDYAFCAWCHDEAQIAARTEDIAHVIGRVCVEAAAESGEFFNFKCPLTAEYKVGKNWKETH